MAHAAAGCERHLGVLNVEGRAGKKRKPPGVIVVKMRDDDVADGAGVDPDRGERCSDRRQHPSLPRAGDFGRKAGIDDNRSGGVADHPDVIVERHVSIVQIRDILGV